MTRIAIIPVLTDGRAGLWSVARSEGRIPMNWGALLAANGYEVVVVSLQGDSPECRVPGVTFATPDEVGDVDWVIFGSTSVLSSNWFGRYTIRTRHVVRLQWPTGGRVDDSGDILAVAHPALVGQVASECGRPREAVNVLPSPVLPLSWWQQVCGHADSPWPNRKYVMWAAREAFGNRDGGSQIPFGEAALAALERRGSGLRPFVLSAEQYDPSYGSAVAAHRARERFAALGAEFTSNLHLGATLAAMRESVIAITQPLIMGPTLTEAVFEDCAPLVWSTYRSLFPELVEAATKHGLLLDGAESVGPVIDQLIDDRQLRARYTDSCKFAFTDHSPEKTMAAWKALEARFA